MQEPLVSSELIRPRPDTSVTDDRAMHPEARPHCRGLQQSAPQLLPLKRAGGGAMQSDRVRRRGRRQPRVRQAETVPRLPPDRRMSRR